PAIRYSEYSRPASNAYTFTTFLFESNGRDRRREIYAPWASDRMNAIPFKYRTGCGIHVVSCSRYYLVIYLIGSLLDLYRDFHLFKLVIFPLICIGFVGVFMQRRSPLTAFVVIDTIYSLGLVIFTLLFDHKYGIYDAIFGSSSPIPSPSQGRESYRCIIENGVMKELMPDARRMMRAVPFRSRSGPPIPFSELLSGLAYGCFWMFLFFSIFYGNMVLYQMSEFLYDRERASQSALHDHGHSAADIEAAASVGNRRYPIPSRLRNDGVSNYYPNECAIM
ncbi:hypothetical protein PMAYCL1PPCAC_27628, partial [Pristionchus mayeri]